MIPVERDRNLSGANEVEEFVLTAQPLAGRFLVWPLSQAYYRASAALVDELIERDARVWQAQQSAAFSVLDWLAADVVARSLPTQRGRRALQRNH
jgi:hypothetical protein